jgi:hypothetical protein
MRSVVNGLAGLLVLWMSPVILAQARAPDRPAQTQTQEPKAETPKRVLVDPAEWAPADALVYVGVTDVGETWEGFKQTSAYQLLSDREATKGLAELDPIGTAVEELKKRLAAMLEVPAEQLKNPFAGALVFYLTSAPGGKPEDVEPGLIAGVGDREVLKKYYESAVNKLKEQARHEAIPAEGTTIDTFTREADKSEKDEKSDESEDDLDEGPPTSPDAIMKKAMEELFAPDMLPSNFAMCLTEDRLVVAASPERVKAILRQERGTRTLADTDDHKALLRHLKPTGTVRVLVNLPRIISLVKAATSESDAEDLRQALRVIGADSLSSVVGHLRVGASSYDSKFELLFLMSGERSGLAKLLSLPNRPSTPPATVSADTCIYASCNVQVSPLLDEIERMIRQNDAAEADAFRAAMQVELPDGTKVDWRKDFLDHLQAPLTVTLALTKPLAANCARLLIGLGHRDQGALVRILSNAAVTQVPLAARELRGAQVFDVPPMPPFLPPGLTLAATTDRLLLGNQPAVEAAVGGAATEPLGETEGWKRVARFVPEESWLTVYVDNRKLLEAVIELSKKREELMAAGPSDFSSLIVFGLMEGLGAGLGEAGGAQSEKLLRYSSQAVYTISTTPEGVQLTAVQLRPESN